LTTPAFDALVAARLTGNLNTTTGVLQYDSNTQLYTRIPANQVSINPSGNVSFSIPGAGTYYVVSLSLNTAPIAKAFGSAVLIAANSGQSVAIQAQAQGNAAQQQTILTISNIQAQAGIITTGIIQQAAALQTSIQATGRVAVSGGYNLTHSLGGTAVASATLSYDTAISTATGFQASTAAWYKFDVGTNAWILQGGTVSGTVVSYTTVSGFSQWSVQATNKQNGAGSSVQAPSALLLSFLAIASIAFRFY